MLTRIPKGTKDVLPAESPRLQAVEALMREKARLAGYAEIRNVRRIDAIAERQHRHQAGGRHRRGVRP